MFDGVFPRRLCKALNLRLPHVYPITDTRISGLSHTEQVERLIAGGATLVQLREKDASPAAFLDEAIRAIAVARPFGIKIIINDRVDIAIAAKADGVHLGQDDLPPAHARELLGAGAIIGFSTHSVEQAVNAVRFPIDYLAIGPTFATTSKADTEPVVGLDGLRQVRDAIGDFPLVAIGGINKENLSAVFEAGADSAAMIGAILSEPATIEPRMREFLCSQSIKV